MCYFIFASEMSPRKQFQLRHPIGGVVASPLFAAKHPVTKMLATTARAMVILLRGRVERLQRSSKGFPFPT